MGGGFIFVYRVLGGPRVGRDSLLYFNFIFFKNSVLANVALYFLVLGYMSAAFVEYRREDDFLMLLANLMGGALFFFLVYTVSISIMMPLRIKNHFFY